MAAILTSAAHARAAPLDEAVVALFPNKGSSHCSGVLIAPKLVLTAAHCLFDGVFGSRVFFEGKTQAEGKFVAVTGVRYHPSFKTGAQQNDLAALYLAVPAPVAPLAIVSHPLGASLLHDPVRIVSFDAATSSAEPARERRSATTVATELKEWDFALQQVHPPLCTGTSGGAILVPEGSSEALAGLLWGGDARCEEVIRAGRVDKDFVRQLLQESRAGVASTGPLCSYETGCARGKCLPTLDGARRCARNCDPYARRCPAGLQCVRTFDAEVFRAAFVCVPGLLESGVATDRAFLYVVGAIVLIGTVVVLRLVYRRRGPRRGKAS